MKVAVIGSRSLLVDCLERFLPKGTTEIVSGGAAGIDTCAREYAQNNGIPIIEFLPDYARYGKRAPLVRNDELIQYSDCVLAFWDGRSRGTLYVIERCRMHGVPVTLFLRSDPKA